MTFWGKDVKIWFSDAKLMYTFENQVSIDSFLTKKSYIKVDCFEGGHVEATYEVKWTKLMRFRKIVKENCDILGPNEMRLLH